MFVNFLVLFLCINTAFGLTAIPGQPTYLEGSQNCYYDPATAPELDPFIDGGTNANDFKDEIMFPTNSTATDVNFGDGTLFNSITESLEASYKAIETMKVFISTNIITATLDNVVFCIPDRVQTFDSIEDCTDHNYDWCATLTYPAQNPNYEGLYSQANPVWDYFTNSISIIAIVLMALTVFYWITGRGHILSS